MDVNKYLALAGGAFCATAQFGSTTKAQKSSIITGEVRKNINANTDCDTNPLKTPTIPCPPNSTGTCDPYSLIIGGPAQLGGIVFGMYLFDRAKSKAPTAAELALDILNFGSNYTEDAFDPILSTVILNSTSNNNVAYHVFRVLVNHSLTIIDAGGVDITSMFKLESDNIYNYYYTGIPIKPSYLTYNITA